MRIADADLGGEAAGGAGVVAGEQERCAAGERGQGAHGVGGVWTHPVGHGEHPGGDAVDGEHHRGVPGGLGGLDGGAHLRAGGDSTGWR